MKIGILTYHRAHNYGALLQAYALQNFLLGLGHEVSIIDYWPEYHSSDYVIFPKYPWMSFKSKIKRILLFCIGFIKIFKRRNGYIRFAIEQFKLTKHPLFVTPEMVNTASYDLVIYGSDQIWTNQKHNSYKFTGFDEVYFGSYPGTLQKKISYAASMGVIDLSIEDCLFLERTLKKFHAISVREIELEKVIRERCNCEASLVLDPVFLLTKEKWRTLIPNIPPKKKYIFLYHLLHSEDAILLTKRLEDYFGYKVLEIPGTNVNPCLISSRYRQTESPFGFLSLISNAEYVISTSFHGMAFSLIFEKQFYALGMGANSGRATSLLSLLGIQNRYIHNIDDANYKEEINYKLVNNNINILREKSIDFIMKSML
jgi:hypothetical protein